MSDPQVPTPEQLQKRLADFMRLHFGDKVNVAAVTSTQESGEKEEPASPRWDASIFEFHYTPRDIKRHLDRFVIKQDEAKKVLSIAVCDHYNHSRWVAQQEKEGSELHYEYAKQNVILLGPTGVGKTYLVKHVADLIGVPFVKADATKFSETGYVGGDVEDLVRELVQKADGNIRLAEHGIIFIDEVDKIASASHGSGRDVSGRGVQTTLLKLMEETEVALRSPTDLQAQIQAAIEFQRKGAFKKESISTRHILFIVSGAFDKLREQIVRRLKESSIGFGASPSNSPDEENVLQHVTTRDLVDYGLEPEFVGRLPVRVVCEPLNARDLFEILKSSEGSILHQYERAFRSYGIEAHFQEDGMQRIAEMAAEEKTGARGLLTVCEKVFRNFKYELPGAGVVDLRVDAAVVDRPDEALQALMQRGFSDRDRALAEAAKQFSERFSQQHGVRLRFAQDGLDRLVELAGQQDVHMHDLCSRLFKDYQFGLKLILRNSGQTDFELGRDAVENPDGVLSQWVVASYRDGGSA